MLAVNVEVHLIPKLPTVVERVQGLVAYVPLPPVVEKLTVPAGRVLVPVSVSVTVAVHVVAAAIPTTIGFGVHEFVVVVTRFVTVTFCAVAVLVEWLLSPA